MKTQNLLTQAGQLLSDAQEALIVETGDADPVAFRTGQELYIEIDEMKKKIMQMVNALDADEDFT